jgi:hypothetical protein
MFIEKVKHLGSKGTEKQIMMTLNAEEMTHIVNALYHYDCHSDLSESALNTYMEAMMARDVLVYGMVQEHTLEVINKIKTRTV